MLPSIALWFPLFMLCVIELCCCRICFMFIILFWMIFHRHLTLFTLHECKQSLSLLVWHAIDSVLDSNWSVLAPWSRLIWYKKKKKKNKALNFPVCAFWKGFNGDLEIGYKLCYSKSWNHFKIQVTCYWVLIKIYYFVYHHIDYLRVVRFSFGLHFTTQKLHCNKGMDESECYFVVPFFHIRMIIAHLDVLCK